MVIDQGAAALLVAAIALVTTLWQSYFLRDVARKAQRDEHQFTRSFEIEKRTYDDKQLRQEALHQFRADLVEIQRHSRENWFVLHNMLQGIKEPSGTPLVSHIKALRYLSDYKSIQAAQVGFLDDELASCANQIRTMLNNVNHEIEECLALARERDAIEVKNIIAQLLIPKAEVFFTIWTVRATDRLHEALCTDWLHNPSIEQSRRDELSSRNAAEWKVDSLDGSLIGPPVIEKKKIVFLNALTKGERQDGVGERA